MTMIMTTSTSSAWKGVILGWTALLGTAAGLLVHSSGNPDQKVTVRVFGEAGCPFTREYLLGAVREALWDPILMPTMDFEFSAFGNAYFVTAQCQAESHHNSAGCGGGGSYNATERACFSRTCGLGAQNRSSDCFTGPLICQHGVKECVYNRYLACSRRLAQKETFTYHRYMPFVLCMVEKYPDTPGGDPFKQLLTNCAAQSNLSLPALESCYGSEAGTAVIAEEAAHTPVHPGVPYVTVNGFELAESYKGGSLRRTVQSALAGAVPPAGSLEALSHQHVTLRQQEKSTQEEQESPPAHA